MHSFSFEDELVLLDGIRKGLGEQWCIAEKWIKIYARGEIVDVFLEPPSKKQMLRKQELVLAEIPDGRLEAIGKLVGYDMAVYLIRHKRYIEPSALPS